MNQSLGFALLSSWATENNRLYRDEPYLIRLRRLRRVSLVILAVLLFLAGRAFAATNADAPTGKPDAAIDLATKEGVDLVKGQWRYSDTKIVEVDFKAAGADKQPTGAPIKTYDYTPHAGGADFDDSKWEAIEPTTLDARRSTGRLCFNWYRINITIPRAHRRGRSAGMTAVFETALDDYAEIWVDGELSRALGQSGGSVVKGWNAPNRLDHQSQRPARAENPARGFRKQRPALQPADQLHLDARGEAGVLQRRRRAGRDHAERSQCRSRAQRSGARRDRSAEPEDLQTRGGLQVHRRPGLGSEERTALLFSDPNNNTIYKYSPEDDGQLTVFREKSGYEGADIAEYGQPGSNGLTFDPQGRLTINQHGNRRVVRVEADGQLTVLADKFEGKRLNSPNDLVYRSDGTLYLTDPPFGLPKFFDDQRKELPFSGVFAVKDGNVRLVAKDFTGPNGIAFSPDEKFLYVGDWDEKKKVVMRYEVQPDGSLKNGKLFFDMTSAPGEDALDGIKVDKAGNLYVSGPGGSLDSFAGGKTSRHDHRAETSA